MHRLTVATICGISLIAFYAGLTPVRAGAPEILEAECHRQLKLGDDACACIGEQAEKQLSERQQALVVALVTKDQAAGGAVQAELTVEEMTEAGKFMQEAPKLCATR